jgi:hypothetical protein
MIPIGIAVDCSTEVGMAPHPVSTSGLLVVAAVLIFSVARRLRRSVGRQVLRPRLLTMRAAFLCLAAAALLTLGVRHGVFFWHEAAGLAVGGALSWWGLHLTQLEAEGERHFYTPNLYIGLGLTLAFVLRVGYRMAVFAPMVGGGGEGMQDHIAQLTATDDLKAGYALTMSLMLATMGYYACYNIGLLYRSSRLKAVNSMG